MYEASYSKQQLHFLAEPSDLLLLDGSKEFRAILDLGAGGGRNSVHLRELFPSAALVPLDVSEIRCIACQEVLGAPPVCGDGLFLPFCDEAFDLVVSTQVIEHVPDDRAFAAEVSRVLSPEGIALVSSVVRMRYAWYFYRNGSGVWALDPTHLREYRSLGDFLTVFPQELVVLRTDVDRFRFSIGRLVYRLLLRIGAIEKADPGFFARSPVRRALGQLCVRIPRYQRVTALMMKA